MANEVVLSCTKEGTQALNVTASAKGVDEKDAYYNLIDRIVEAAKTKRIVRCDDICEGSGIDRFCYATLTFEGAVQYVRKPVPINVIAYYSGKATMQCHCFQDIKIELDI